MDQESESAPPRCPTCGAALQPEAAACPECGTLLADLSPTPPTSIELAPLQATPPDTEPDTEPDMEHAPTPTMAADPTERCGWCGQLSPAGAEQCAHCGAMFPRPEADAALLRQAEDRMRAELDMLNTMRRNRTQRRERKGFGRMFRE